MRRKPLIGLWSTAVVLFAGGCATQQTAIPSVRLAEDDALASLRADADALRPMAETDAARDWLDETSRLPVPEPRTVYYRPRSVAYTPGQFENLTEEEKANLREYNAGTRRYYSTFYGTPVAYMRALDIIASRAGISSFEGKRVLDFGYGQIGQLRMLAQLGADAVGVDNDPTLGLLYAESGDQGVVENDGTNGSVHVIHGEWPSDASTRAAVGTGFDIFTARNVLKRGYVHPTEPTPDWAKVGLGMEDAEFLKTLHDVLRPGGVALIYNLGGAKRTPDDRYNPSSDIACPWSREQFERAGFEVLAHDEDEDGPAREVGRALGWGERMDLDNALFGSYTLVRRAD